MEQVKIDINDPILLLDIKIKGHNFILLNITNTSTEKKQLNILTELKNMSNSVSDIFTRQVILGDNFDF